MYAAPGISASPFEDNMRYFNVMILGPTQSPYEGSRLSSIILSLCIYRNELYLYCICYMGIVSIKDDGCNWLNQFLPSLVRPILI